MTEDELRDKFRARVERWAARLGVAWTVEVEVGIGAHLASVDATDPAGRTALIQVNPAVEEQSLDWVAAWAVSALMSRRFSQPFYCGVEEWAARETERLAQQMARGLVDGEPPAQVAEHFRRQIARWGADEEE